MLQSLMKEGKKSLNRLKSKNSASENENEERFAKWNRPLRNVKITSHNECKHNTNSKAK